MPFSNAAPALVLFLVGAGLCAGNVWYAAVRSTIPVSIDGVITARRLLTEHTPGLDDVCLLTLDGGRTLHVDKPVYEAVSVGERLQKSAWSRELQHADQRLPLAWSRDAQQMIWVMPLVLLVLAMLFRFAARYIDPTVSSVEHSDRRN